MNAKSDVFDVPMGGVSGPWAGRARDEGPELWPAEEHERTTVRAFAIPALEDEVDDDEYGEPLPVHRAPRSSSPDLPLAALLLLRKPAASFPEASIDEAIEDEGDDDVIEPPSASMNARIEQLLDSDGDGDGDGDGDDAELEVQIELVADSGDHGSADDYREDDDPDIECSDNDDRHAAAGLAGVPSARRASRDPSDPSEETDEDASWWMRIDASSLDGLPLSQELELDDLPGDLATAGVVSGTAGGPSLQRRLLIALDAPTDVECSCGHDCDLREQALREMFRELTAAESRTLHLRLSLARHEDSLALAFAAMPREHRTRLLDFLDQHARRRVLEGANWRVIRRP
jgi:hypothetical protein